MPRTAYALLGPTASGKSRLALQLAETLPVEIVSLDSALVYRGMDIGTAKPTAAERERVPHHLVDLVDPDHSFSTGRWRSDAVRAIADIFNRGGQPLLVGGTMLYYRALVAGLDTLPQADQDVRAQLDAEAARRGWPALHADLEKVDSRSARRIKATDAQRIQRALEVYRITGKPLSSLQGVSRADLPFEVRGFALIPSNRDALHKRIEERFDQMLDAGLVEELRELRRRYVLSAGMPSMRAVGYRQAWDFLEHKIDENAMRQQAVVATRQLAKRQMTWLRSFAEVVRLDGGSGGDAAGAFETLHEALTRSCKRPSH